MSYAAEATQAQPLAALAPAGSRPTPPPLPDATATHLFDPGERQLRVLELRGVLARLLHLGHLLLPEPAELLRLLRALREGRGRRHAGGREALRWMMRRVRCAKGSIAGVSVGVEVWF